MNIQKLQKHWNELGKQDPMWAVLTDPEKKGGKWNPADFFATGREEIASVLAQIDSLGITLPRGRALDFGCGVGRLSQALAEKFERVDGVDISPSMLEQARGYNRHPDNCHYHLNSKPDLGLFPDGTFDFIYTIITLQHIPPAPAQGYIKEFMRLLKPGGVAVFQVLKPTFIRGLIPDWFVSMYRSLKHGDQAFISMYGLRESNVARIIQQGGARLADLSRTPSTSPRWLTMRYTVVKQ